MKSALQELIDEEVEEAVQENTESVTRQFAMALLRLGDPVEKVAYVTNLPAGEIKALADIVKKELSTNDNVKN